MYRQVDMFEETKVQDVPETFSVEAETTLPGTTYRDPRKAGFTEEQILEAARDIVDDSFNRMSKSPFKSPQETKDHFMFHIGNKTEEVFRVMYLDNRHRLIHVENLFHGGVNGASVSTRLVVRRCMELNAASLVIGHNHPSGVSDPSESDRTLTKKLIAALELIDVRVLDHIVTGETPVSMAQLGLM